MKQLVHLIWVQAEHIILRSPIEDRKRELLDSPAVTQDPPCLIPQTKRLRGPLRSHPIVRPDFRRRAAAFRQL